MDAADDTPKAFARLMAFQNGQKLRKGLDDGIVPTKASKKAKKAAAGDDLIIEKKEREDKEVVVPRIKPGERMNEFSARVDAALPVSGLINKTAKNGKDPLGLKVGRTKKEKKMHKLYDSWREDEARLQEKRLAAQEEKEMEELEEREDGQVVWKDVDGGEKKGKKKKGKKRKVAGEVDDGEADPWAKIAELRGGKAKFGDVVLAPPTFTKVPSAKFKMEVPKASGSLRRREELGEVRRSVVEGYRAMMAAGKGKAEE